MPTDAAVRPKSDAHARSLGHGHCTTHHGPHVEGLGSNGRWEVTLDLRHLHHRLPSEEGGDKVGPCLLEQLDGLLIQEAAVIDGVDASTKGRLDPIRTMGMGRHPAPEAVGRLNDGLQLVVEELLGGPRIGPRQNSPGGRELDHVRTALDLQSDSLTARVRTICDPQCGTRKVEQVLAIPMGVIAMTARW